MADDTYYNLEEVKDLLGESGDSNNDKITVYGRMADNKVNNSLARVRDADTGDVVLPFSTVPETIKDLATVLTLGYFYKFESASTDILEQALADLIEHIDNTYRRIRFQAASAPV